jgi:transposase
MKSGRRGRAVPQSNFVSLISAEELIRADHPVRRIKRMVDEVLREMNGVFAAMYSDIGSPSIPPERLLKAKILQALYSIRSARQIVERIRTDVLFRWFLDMNLDDALFDASVFSKNQDRLLEHDVALIFFNKVYAIATRNKWASDDHFSADGTLIQA